MYVSAFVLAVPEQHKEAYREIAEKFWDIAKDYGAIEHVEAWEMDVPDGKQTDFRRAVQIEPGEKVVFAWMIYPDRETADASHDKITADRRMKQFGDEMPFDGKRMIYGGFEPLIWKGRD